MKAIWIDTPNKSIVSIDMLKGLEHMQKKVNGLIERAQCDLPGNHDLWVNEEGIYKCRHLGHFYVENAYQPYIGRGLILGRGRSDSVDCRLTVEQVEPKILFLSDREAYNLAVKIEQDAYGMTIAKAKQFLGRV